MDRVVITYPALLHGLVGDTKVKYMAIYYSESVGGFLGSDIWKTLPSDSIIISKEEHNRLLNGQKKGSRITSLEGKPQLSVPLKPTQEEIFLLGAKNVRTVRDGLLKSSDWTQVLDSPVDRVAWADYRQELRVITSQETFPSEVTWPVAPQ